MITEAEKEKIKMLSDFLWLDYTMRIDEPELRLLTPEERIELTRRLVEEVKNCTKW